MWLTNCVKMDYNVERTVKSESDFLSYIFGILFLFLFSSKRYNKKSSFAFSLLRYRSGCLYLYGDIA